MRCGCVCARACPYVLRGNVYGCVGNADDVGAECDEGEGNDFNLEAVLWL